MFRHIKDVFLGLSSIANTPDHVKCISLNNQPCMIQPTFQILMNTLTD